MTDPNQTVYDRIVALLLAEPAFYDAAHANKARIWPANLIHYGTGSKPEPDKWPHANDESFPLALLEIDNSTNEAFRGNITFATFAPAGPPCFNSRINTLYRLTVVGRDKGIVLPSALTWAAQTTLIKALPSLGSVAKMFGPLTIRNRVSNQIPTPQGPQPLGRFRRMFTLDIPVVFEFTGKALEA